MKDVTVQFFRASGPGGQHRNKTASAVQLTHLPTGLVVEATEERCQHKNRAVAFQRLETRLQNLAAERRAAARRAAPESEAESILRYLQENLSPLTPIRGYGFIDWTLGVGCRGRAEWPDLGVPVGWTTYQPPGYRITQETIDAAAVDHGAAIKYAVEAMLRRRHV